MSSVLAQALLHEFNTVVAPQKSALSQRLPQLFQQYYSPPPELGGGASAAGANGSHHPGAAKVAKRSAAEQMQSQDSKRLKQQPSAALNDLERRQEALFKDVANLLKRLLGKKESGPFREPVDPVKLKIPDYFNFVKHPMDLGTVKNNLQNKAYKTPADACRDVRQVWRNCAAYNPVGHPVRRQGDALSDFWEKSWAESRIEERWSELLLEKEPSVVNRVAHLNIQLKSAVSLVPPGSVPRAPAGAMSDLDKRRLSIQLADLQGEHMNELLLLIQNDLPGGSGVEEEVELDLDTLTISTLIKMQAYVNGVVSSRPNTVRTAPPKAAPPAGPGSGAPAPAVGSAPGAGHAAAAMGIGPQHDQPSQQQEQEEDGGGVSASSGQASPGAGSGDSAEVGGSTADDPHASKGGGGRGAGGAGVDESATAPHTTSSILKDRNAARKPDVQVNAANWDVEALQGGGGDADGQEEEEQEEQEDEVWKNFQSREEQKRQQAEEQRKLREQQESELRKIKGAEEEEAQRIAKEQEEKERALAAEEERIQAEQQRARMEQCDKEVDEIKARQGTANLQRDADMQNLAHTTPNDGDLAAVGLTFRNDDDDVNFEDEE